MATYTYSIATDTAGAKLYSPTLKGSIVDSTITTAFNRIDSEGDTLNVVFDGDLTTEENTTLDSLVSLHDGSTPADQTVTQNVHIVDSDNDTAAIPVTTKFAPDGFYQRLHEIEFTTSTVDGAIHDKDHNNLDTGWSSCDFYEDIAGTETLMVSPTQNDLDSKCIRTDYKFMPLVDYMVMSGVISHQTIPTSEVYMWGIMLDVDPALNAYGIFPIEVLGGGMAMTFVKEREQVGLRGVNGSMLHYSAVSNPSGGDPIVLPPGLGTNRIRFMMRHDLGFKHRFQAIFEIFRA